MPRTHFAAAFLLAGIAAAGCSNSSSRSPALSATVSASSSAAVSSASPAPTTSASAAPTASASVNTNAPGYPLTLGVRDAIARRHAPRLRFNAHVNDGNTARQNTNEDFFPMGVRSFLRQITTGTVRLVTQESRGATPSETEVVQVAQRPQLHTDRLRDTPRRMAGDPPGAAPTYTHVYEDPAGRQLNADGSGQLVVFAEYWVFYAHDRAEARFIGVPFNGNIDIMGHRSDWEHTAYRLAVELAPGGDYLRATVDEGYYYSHGKGFTVEAHELELLDEQGDPDPQGSHPVVYVSQGKHASYPEAGEWKDHAFPVWVGDHTDFFRGNGVWVDTWNGTLIDLEDTAGVGVLQSVEFDLLQASSPHGGLPDWTAYRGRWGPDERALSFPLLGRIMIGASATGPKTKTNYGDFGGGGTAPLWRDLKARTSRLTAYGDVGIAIPRANPLPFPVAR